MLLYACSRWFHDWIYGKRVRKSEERKMEDLTMRIYKEKEIHTTWNPYNNEKFYMVLVTENELRIFHHLPKRIKVWETVEGEEDQDYHGHFYHTRVRTGEYELHWGIEEDFGNEYGMKLPISAFSGKVQSMLKVNRVISIEPNGKINIEVEA